MTMASATVRADFEGIIDPRFAARVIHYRGITYANIARRFAKPVVNREWAAQTKVFTNFGPRCPQVPVDLRAGLMCPRHVPEDVKDTEDELKCTNLNVTCPADSSRTNLPVLIWIYGGAQTFGAGSASQRLGDAGPLVAQAIERGKPIILVTMHYRLNIFAFGNGEDGVNLAVYDQKAAVDWVKHNISTFGGNPSNITVGGQSAGAIYTHALVASDHEGVIQRAILASGSLYAQPPRAQRDCVGLLGLIEGNLQLMELENGNAHPEQAEAATLVGAPADRLVQCLQDLQVASMWMWQENILQDWHKDATVWRKLQGVMIGDCEDEAIIYSFVTQLSAAKIAQCFETQPAAAGERLRKAYGVDVSDEEASRRGALQFINDARFAFPAQRLAQNAGEAGVDVFPYHFDQVNPFAPQAQASAQHGIDLLACFGGYDEYVTGEMLTVGKALRNKWIDFLHGEEPWPKHQPYGYGPHGATGLLTAADIAARRRLRAWDVLRDVGREEVYDAIWKKLLAVASTASDK